MRKLDDKSKGKVDEGYTNPELTIPSDITPGTKKLTALYKENEIYLSSLARSILYYGTKVYLHCPTLYYYTGTKPVTLKAVLFTNNRKVSLGNFLFKINGLTVTNKLRVSKGYVEKTVDYTAKRDVPYQGIYEGSVSTTISNARDDSQIIVISSKRTKLVIEVTDIICAKRNEQTKLIARVYHLNNNGIINGNIPEGGEIEFFIDGISVGKTTEITYSGFVSINYVASASVGVHEITATYTPNTEELKKKYDPMSGAGTLFIGTDNNKPVITELSENIGTRGTTATLNFESDKTLNGTIKLFLDNELVPDISETGEEKIVSNTTTFSLNVVIPNNPTMAKPWVYGGAHNMILVYTREDGMEYYYYMEDFWILLLTKPYIDSDVNDFTTLDLFKLVNNEINVVTPRTDSNIVIGDYIDFIVKIIEEEKLIKNGVIDIEIKTRKG